MLHRFFENLQMPCEIILELLSKCPQAIDHIPTNISYQINRNINRNYVNNIIEYVIKTE